MAPDRMVGWEVANEVADTRPDLHGEVRGGRADELVDVVDRGLDASLGRVGAGGLRHRADSTRWMLGR
jgi:hypothetical protein